MNGRRLALFVAVAGSAAVAAVAPTSAEPRAVIELFTSQGCSSCPPADKLAGQLIKDPTLVTLTLAIDYWDYLGWKDTLALAGHGKRQKAYARMRGDREVYTPQAVVNGMAHVLGSDRSAIDRAIAETRRGNPEVLSVAVAMTVRDGKIAVDLPAGRVPADKQGNMLSEIWLCPMTSKVTVAIERGENRGKTITYHNVVRRWIRLGEWSGKAESLQFPVANLPHKELSAGDVDAVAVVLQSGGAATPGPMLGAAVAAVK